MQIYKKGQGKIVRRVTHLSLWAFIAYGCYGIYDIPSTDSWWWKNVLYEEPSVNIIVRPILLVAVGVFLLFASLVFMYLNREKTADFLIESEDEIRKVSWPSRKEYVTSSIVVIVMVIIVAGFLFFVDKGLSFAMEKINIGF